MDGLLAPAPVRRGSPLVNAVLFVATAGTTLVSGWAMTLAGPPAAWPSLGEVVLRGLPFAAALMGILLAHEMGHYLAARRYGVDATLPYFIPFPLGIGTFGAVIRIRSAMP